jgi:predicted PurR-regulated permease PerM
MISVWTATMNIPLTGNSGDKNRKWPRLSILATAVLLLSVISFIGVGAISHPPQAFAQGSNVTQTIGQLSDQSATAVGNIDQSALQAALQDAQATGNVDQTVVQAAAQFANATGP